MAEPWERGPGVVVFPDGSRIRGVGWRRQQQWAERTPDFSLVLLGKDLDVELAWPHRWVRWPDFGLPTDRSDAVDAVREAHARGRHERVDIGCGGGVGRTGTALALVAVLSGVPGDRAVAWVREHHHPRAVETPWQRRWVSRMAADLG